ncbi:MAG: glycosyltransferase family 39 protein [Candidatus Obscuribacterales bacterium]|nr:glycosyltransferase family 39 protein [Candidatus Obscuribacterales bacterium]
MNESFKNSKQLYWTFVLLSVLALLIHLALFINVNLDDAYITYRYSEHLANGFGPVWNTAERPVEGYSNFLWMLLNAGAIKVGIDPLIASKTIGCISAFAICFLPLSGLFKILPERSSQCLLIATCVFCPALIFYAQAGLESALFTLLTYLVSISFSAYLHKSKSRYLYISAASAGLAALCRPEGLGVFGIALIFLLSLAVKNNSLKQESKSILLFATIFLSFFLPHFIWRLCYYGYPFPNTFYAKHSDGGLDQIFLGVIYLSGGLSQYLALPIIFTVLSSHFALSQKAKSPQILDLRVLGFLLYFIFCYSLYVVTVGGDDYTAFKSYRLLLPIIPVAYLMAAISSSYIQNLRPSGYLRYLPSFCFVILILAVNSKESHELLKAYNYNAISSKDGFLTACRKLFLLKADILQEPELSKWIRQELPEGGLLAIAQAGKIPYFCKLNCLDTLGLNDLHIAHSKKRQRGIDVKMDANYVLKRKPDLIFINVDRQVVSGKKTFEEGGGWKLGDKELLNLLANNPDYQLVDAPTIMVCYKRSRNQ